jgi:hypothetical protein
MSPIGTQSGNRTRSHSITSSAQQDRDREAQPRRLCSVELDDYLECCRTLGWKDRWAQTLQNLAMALVCISRATFSADSFAQCERCDFSDIVAI